MSAPGRYARPADPLRRPGRGRSRDGSRGNPITACNTATQPTESFSASRPIVVGDPIFGAGCHENRLPAYETDWNLSEMIAGSGEAPMGGVVEVIVAAGCARSDTRLVVVRKGCADDLGDVGSRRKSLEDVAQFVTDLPGIVDHGRWG